MVDLNTKEGPSSVVVGGRIGSQDVPKLEASISCYLLTPSSTVLPEKLTGSQLVKKFPAFYGTWRFIPAFTSSRHLSLSWVISIQSMPPQPTSWRSVLILLFHLNPGLPSGLFCSRFPTKPLYTHHLSPIRASCSGHLILLGLVTGTIMSEVYR